MMTPQLKSRKKRQPKAATAKGRSRILKTADSSSEDETHPGSNLNKSEWISSQINKEISRSNKNRIKSSSTSTSDEFYLVKKSVQGIKRLKNSTSTESDSPIVTGLTQALPLKERVRQRLQQEAFAKGEKEMARASAVGPSHSSPPFTRLKPVEDKFQRMDATVKNVKTSVSPTSQTVGKDSGSEKEFSRSTSSLIRTVSDTRASRGKTLPTEQHCSSHREPSRGREGDALLSCRTSLAQDEPKQLNASSHITPTNIPQKTSPQGLSREERLKLAKIKQENFRKKQMTERNPAVPPLSATGDGLFWVFLPVVKFDFFHNNQN